MMFNWHVQHPVLGCYTRLALVLVVAAAFPIALSVRQPNFLVGHVRVALVQNHGRAPFRSDQLPIGSLAVTTAFATLDL